MTRKYIFYISQNYSFEILRPIQQAIWERGDQCAWFIEGNDVNPDYLRQNEKQLDSIRQIIDYSPTAVFVPGNIVPKFIPGLKIQVFHGLEWKKKSHFRIRGFFDLYCTHGPITTNQFNRLAQQHRHFQVIETGWSKLDPLFHTQPFELNTKLPVILFAPTFSPNLTCALECFDEIKRLVETNKHYWLAKFHPKMNSEWVELYKEINADNFQVVETDSCLPLLQRADILLSDTSSIIGEFLLLNKPAVTYKNSNPGPYLIDIKTPQQLNNAIEKAILFPEELSLHIKRANQQLHPFDDGHSSQRILDAVDKLVDERTSGPENIVIKKPLNIFRTLKLRKKLGYWRW